MGFKRVRFNNFKNIEPREMQWFPGLNLITGENGAGKTNILEGMNILSGWGSLERGTKAKTLPNWESGAADVQLTGELETNEIIRVKVSTRTTIKVDEKSATASALRQKV
ncbi:MAG: AAA family ATPase, partial [Synergistes sp.]|nr:AAA family ATPase [Synergistes sp.]